MSRYAHVQHNIKEPSVIHLVKGNRQHNKKVSLNNGIITQTLTLVLRVHEKLHQNNTTTTKQFLEKILDRNK